VSHRSAFMLGRLPSCKCADVGVISVFITTLRHTALPGSCISSCIGAASVYTSCSPLALLLHISSLMSVLATFTKYITSHFSCSTTCLHVTSNCSLSKILCSSMALSVPRKTPPTRSSTANLSATLRCALIKTTRLPIDEPVSCLRIDTKRREKH
jgi:hypothetical protein